MAEQKTPPTGGTNPGAASGPAPQKPQEPAPAADAKPPEDPKAMGEKILAAVERITESPAAIAQLVEDLRHRTTTTDELANEIVSHYSTRAAISGGATALTALLPGIGTVAYLLTGPLADMVLLLKFETEMCCALSAAHGFDITKTEERQLAFLLAAVKTSEASTGRSVLVDLGETSWTAVWNYAPRRVTKFLVEVLALIALSLVTRRWIAAIPVVGVAVGAGMNKYMTTRVGEQAHAEIKVRKLMAAKAAEAAAAAK